MLCCEEGAIEIKNPTSACRKMRNHGRIYITDGDCLSLFDLKEQLCLSALDPASEERKGHKVFGIGRMGPLDEQPGEYADVDTVTQSRIRSASISAHAYW